jgi:UDP-N-acetylglucosamine 1-carboxyvinyltransferase
VPELAGDTVEATESRVGSALVLAGLIAEGTTTVWGAKHVDRVYEDLDGKLNQLGASIGRITDDPPPSSKETEGEVA